MTLPILFLLAIALFIIIVILFVRSERRKDRAYASALPSRRQYDCASLHSEDDFAAIANKAADERLEWHLSRLHEVPVDSRDDSIYGRIHAEAPISNSCNYSDSSSFSCDSSSDSGSSSSD